MENFELKENELYKIEFDTQPNGEIKSVNHQFYFLFNRNKTDYEITFHIAKNLKGLERKDVKLFSQKLVKAIYIDCQKCKKYSICDMFVNNSNTKFQDQVYYSNVIYVLFKKIYNCSKHETKIENDMYSSLFFSSIINLKCKML